MKNRFSKNKYIFIIAIQVLVSSFVISYLFNAFGALSSQIISVVLFSLLLISSNSMFKLNVLNKLKSLMENLKLKNFLIEDFNLETALESIKFNILSLESQIDKSKREIDFLEHDKLLLKKFESIILGMSEAFNKYDQKEDLYNYIIQNAMKIHPKITHCSFSKLNEEGYFEFIGSYGYNMEELKNIKVHYKNSLVATLSINTKKEPIILSNVGDFTKKYQPDIISKAFDQINLSTTKLSVLIPIYVDNELFGLLSLDSTDKNAFEEKSLPIFKSFSYFVSVMLKNQILQEKNIYLSKFDKLTGALNRSHFEDVFYEIHKKAIRYREEFTLCLIDLNHLKRTNDTHGHVMGDFLLNSFSNVIRNEIRDSDLFARYGGDEFIIIFFNSSNKETEEKVANIKDKFKNMKFNKNGVELDISFAYGLANFPDESMILDVLVKIADKKMYKDKLNYK